MKHRFSIAVLASLLGAVLLLGAAACTTRQPDPGYRLGATVKDIMDSMVDPGADVLWDAVATVVKATGTEERVPKTDQEWAVLRHNAIMLMEATNLLQMPGRRVALPGQKAENPKIELAPEVIQTMIDGDRQTFSNLAHGLYDTGAEALARIDARDPKGLTAAGEKIDAACETCHLKYWYPKGLQAATAAAGAKP